MDIDHTQGGRPKQVPVFEKGAEAKKNFAAAVTAIVSPDPSKRIETAQHVIHLEPRMSATKLAEYAVADHLRKEAIVKMSKKAPKVVLIYYKHARAAFPHALSPDGLSSDYLLRRADEIKALPEDNDWFKQDNARSSEALKKIAKITKQIECMKGTLITRPPRGWGYLNFGGVRVSVNPELVFTVTERGVTKIGAVILNTGQNDQLSLARSNSRYSVGDYLTVILYQLLETHLKSHGIPARSRCYAVDVFREKVYVAPASHKTMLKHLEAAGKSVVRDWASTPVEAASSAVAVDDEGDEVPF